MAVNVTEVIVHADDIDELNHVNNITYIKFLEKARYDWYEH